ncbi:MAG: ribonuclease R [Planctomycetota bacterium]
MKYQQQLIKLLNKRNYRPMTAEELANELRADDREAFLAELEEMRREGDVAQVKFKRYALPQKVGLVAGTLRCNPGGFGFLTPKPGHANADLYVCQEGMGLALQGDTVLARMQEPSRRRGRRAIPDRGPRAEIVEVLQRARSEIVGTFRKTPNFYCVVPDDPAFLRDIYISQAESLNAKEGDKVVVAISEWTDPHLNPEGRVLKILGTEDDPSIDLTAIICLFNLPTDFPPRVLEEAVAAAQQPLEQALEGRLDLRNETVITIDPEDAKDHDDAVSLRRTRDGFELGVHIADVSHYVRTGTALDREAEKRGTSVYFPGAVLPMLPHDLSSDACSLREGHVRLAKSVLFKFSPDGHRQDFEIRPSVIRNSLRLNYGEAYAALQGDPPARVPEEIVQMLSQMRHLAQMLYDRRARKGSIDLDVPEISISLDDQGKVLSIGEAERNMAHRLIEEFMLAANEAVALYLTKHKAPYLSRVHADPSNEDLDEVRRLTLALGYEVDDPRNPHNLQKLLAQAEGRDDGWLVNIAILRSMRLAEYSAKPDKHFALAFSHYTHFTSPIRRYPDLLVHQVLDEHFAGVLHGPDAKDAWQQRLRVAGPHCSATERRSDDAERLFIKRKILRFLEDHYGERFRARIAGIRNRGMTVRLEKYLIEGMIPFSTMTNDFYRANQARTGVIGRRTKRRYTIGQSVIVTIHEIDHVNYEVVFALAEP